MHKILRSLKFAARKFPRLTVAAIAVLASTAPAMAIEGGWRFQGPYLLLGNYYDGTGLLLSNSPRYCRQSATVGSATIRAMLMRSNVNGGTVNWYVDAECNDGYKRICLTTSLGEGGCNTYRDHGWVDF